MKNRFGTEAASIADWILPHVTNRVLSLVKCPSGAGASCFYAKHAWKGADPALKSLALNALDFDN